MHDTVVHWRNRSSRYGLRSSFGAVFVAQESGNKSAYGKTHANNGQREPRNLINIKCFKCQKFGHFFNKCPNWANTGKTHANVGTKEASDYNLDRLVSTLKIDVDADYLF